jgi:transcriptional regulator with XRE-family HTH domain
METAEGAILRAARDRLGFTQQQVADKAQIQLRQYQRFESGERKLSTSSFYIACNVLNALGLDVTAFAREKKA